MSRFTSRKFIATIGAVMGTLAGIASGAVDPTTGFAIIATNVLGYVMVEGRIDAKRAAAVAAAGSAILAKAAEVLREAEATASD